MEGPVDTVEGFAEYVGARRGRLLRSAVLLGCSLNEAEDIVQTTLMQCYASWSRVARAADPDAYVYRVLVNCLAKSRRRRWWQERPTENLPEGGHHDEAELAAVAQTLRAALQRLSAEQRAVLVLRFLADLSERQVAEVLRIAPGTVKSRTSRGLALLAADARLTDLPGHRSQP
jgi:RNA polymerase sigma-70 factor (sigma-E family)